MDVLLLRTWLANIGNAFIDAGAKTILERSTPNARVHEVSGHPSYAADKKALGQAAGLSHVFGSAGDRLDETLRRRRDTKQNVAQIAEYLDPDVAVLPGCTLYRDVLAKYRNVLESLSDRGTRIVFLGAGGGDYSRASVDYVTDALTGIDTTALLTRDARAYDLYAHMFEYAYDGIDCAFFVDEWYVPPEANAEFSIFTFDKQAEPAGLDRGGDRVIRPSHTPFGHGTPFDGHLPAVWDHVKTTRRTPDENFFVSDLPRDYLFWYANADTTHADRIHACVPALAYGNRARFHYDTPRAALFDQLPLDGITERPVAVPTEALERAKREQVAAAESALSLALA